MKEATVLIVEDEPMTREGLRKALESWGAGKYRFDVKDNGFEALEYIRNHADIELLITDIRMPGMSGLDLVQALKEKKQGGIPPVILISGYAEFEYAQRAIHLGVVEYLLKPVSDCKLIEAVERALADYENRVRIGLMEKIMDPVLIDASRQLGGAGDAVAEAVRYIDEHLPEPLRLKDIADQVHLNPSYFSVLFKEQMGITYSDYVTRRRIQRAKELLVKTKLPIGDIAQKVGYIHVKYFNKMFKEYEHCTPGEYRKQNQTWPEPKNIWKFP
ncbi:response regulator transcription factor [Thermobacillus xylanilyticus]|jgi:YesN/AraC family two-component response regulator|nr:response regulator [Thermobacillus xylanilyticus]